MTAISPTRLVQATAAAWLSYVAVDFVTHAVVLAPWWRATGSFWLPPMQLARRIPFGYLSFVLYAGGLVWLMPRVVGERPRSSRAAAYAAVVGLLVGLVQALANYSVFAMPVSALFVWPLSVTLGSVGGGLAAASVLRAPRPARRLLVVFAVALAIIVVGVVLQNLLFPTPADHLVRGDRPPCLAVARPEPAADAASLPPLVPAPKRGVRRTAGRGAAVGSEGRPL
ncbi:MAG: hypothetical protein KJ058_03400 [Thermoanaerobaculia bacterium]|nr:hypothetical protein [Thermoanaerobaculia bacterium]